MTKEENRIVCCVHGIKCAKGIRERNERNDVFSLSSFYIGALDRRGARRKCRERTNFRLFHLLQNGTKLDQLEPSLNLYIIYRSSDGEYCYFPVVEQEIETGHPKGRSKYFYVDYGNPQAPKFASLQALVRYYSVYVELRPTLSNNGIVPDIFP